MGIVGAIGSLVAWLGYQTYEDRHAAAKRSQFVEAARQGAINLTTIDFATVDSDIQRVLDSSTGVFHDDFQRRSASFAEVVKKVKSKSVGKVTEAALLSEDGDKAKVLVNVSMTMTSTNTNDTTPRGWRMQIGVEQQGDSTKVSDVRFVP
ncbi:hypothetical protein AWC25_00235 [Mycobacterium sherrisii]|nr:mammalian cell entry protein [Mycobacterium sherrisii]ORW74161.1 hypothetical protein AWC25_00235 [Mycobacterium sherrisii]